MKDEETELMPLSSFILPPSSFASAPHPCLSPGYRGEAEGFRMTDTAWAVLLPRASALAAGALRLRGDVRVREADDNSFIWLRGEKLTDELDLELRKLPGARRHTLDA